MEPDYIIIHHSLTKDQKVVDWQAIRKYHIKEKGWKDIGYHCGIELVGRSLDNGYTQFEYEILMGRMLNERGAHCRAQNRNYNSIGICFIGNFDISKPPIPQWNIGIKLVKSFMEIFNIGRFNVLGHNEVAKDGRTCPGKMFDMQQFRQEL